MNIDNHINQYWVNHNNVDHESGITIYIYNLKEHF